MTKEEGKGKEQKETERGKEGKGKGGKEDMEVKK